MGRVVAQSNRAQGVPAPTVLEDLIEERIGRLEIAPVEKDKGGVELNTEESLPACQARDIVFCHP